MTYSKMNGSRPPFAMIERFATTLKLGLIQFTRVVITILAAVLLVVLIYAVASRYIFGFSIVGIEEIAQFLLAWIVFLGVSVALYQREHMAMIALNRRFSLLTRKIIDRIFDLLMILFLLIVAFQGIKLAISVIPQISPVLEISYFWSYISLPVGAILGIIQLIFILMDDIRNSKESN